MSSQRKQEFVQHFFILKNSNKFEIVWKWRSQKRPELPSSSPEICAQQSPFAAKSSAIIELPF